MKKISIFIFIVLLSLFITGVLKLGESNEILARSYDTKESQSERLAYLNSYDNVELTISENDTSYFATKSINSLNDLELLSSNSIDPNDYFVSFEATFVQDVNIFFIKVKLNNSTGMIDQINLLGIHFSMKF